MAKKLHEWIIRNVTERLEEEFENFIKEKGISARIAMKNQDYLSAQIDIKVYEWKNFTIKILASHCKQQSKFIGSRLLTEKIDQQIKKA